MNAIFYPTRRLAHRMDAVIEEGNMLVSPHNNRQNNGTSIPEAQDESGVVGPLSTESVERRLTWTAIFF